MQNRMIQLMENFYYKLYLMQNKMIQVMENIYYKLYLMQNKMIQLMENIYYKYIFNAEQNDLHYCYIQYKNTLKIVLFINSIVKTVKAIVVENVR